MIMTVKEAYDKYRKAANDLVKCIVDKPSEEVTHNDLIVCYLIWNTGESVYKWLKEMGYVK